MIENNRARIQIDEYKQSGVYLLFDNSQKLSLTKNDIELFSQALWRDHSKLPMEIREAADFSLCPICPEKEKRGICPALHPVLPFLDTIDQYNSFDRVTAIYKGEDNDVLHISDTAMSTALQYISTLSLMYYCRTGRKYWRYYFGINPLMDAREVRQRVYLNIYWLYKGDLQAIDKSISTFKNEIKITSQNQIKRLRLVCRNDAFINAFANTHISTDILSFDMEDDMEESFNNFDNL